MEKDNDIGFWIFINVILFIMILLTIESIIISNNQIR